MDGFANLKIAHKLFLSFGLCLALTALISVVAITRMAEMNQAASALKTGTVFRLGALSNFSGPMRQLRITEYRAALKNDPKSLGPDQARLALMKAAAQKNLDAYGASASQPQDKANYAALRSLWDQYAALDGQKLLPALQHGDGAASKTLLNKTMRDVALPLYAQADTMIAWNQNQGEVLAAQANHEYLSARNVVFVLLALILLVGAAVAWLTTRYMTRMLVQISDRITSLDTVCVASLSAAVTALEHGDLTVPITTGTAPLTNLAGDELGQMGRTFNNVLAKMHVTIDSFRKSQRSLSGLIQGMQQSATQVNSAAQTLSGTSRQIGTATEEMNATMQGVAQVSGQSALGAGEVAQGCASQARLLSNSSELIRELTAAIHAVAADAEAATQAAADATLAAETGAAAVTQSVSGMAKIRRTVSESAGVIKTLGEASRSIGAIVQTIDDIAEQTNLLALNAAIEAARAGEAGRGFAVVADEVRKLAERSGGATREIGGLISDIQTRTRQAIAAMEAGTREAEGGSALAEEAGQALARIQTVVGAVTARVEGIQSAAEQVTTAADEVSRSISEVSSVVEQSSSAAEEMSASAEEVSVSLGTVALTTRQQSVAIEELIASSAQLAGIAQVLEDSVARFQIAPGAEEEPPARLLEPAASSLRFAA